MNINPDTTDAFYRYKMPKPNTRFAGGGNGSYTFFDNIDDVSSAINTPSEVLFNFISKSLGSSSNYGKKTITGHHKNEVIISEIYKFIKEFVMCQNCSIPELKPSVQGSKKKKQLFFACSACGSQYIKTSTHKLFDKTIDNIIKNVDKYEFKNGNMVIVEEKSLFNPL